jgi:hypothetical protein
MPIHHSTLDVRKFGVAAGTVAAGLSALCAGALALAPGATRKLVGYLIHADLSGLTPEVTWTSFFISVVGWGLIAGVAFAVAAGLYNRSLGPAPTV